MAATYNLFRNPAGADKEKKNNRLHARLVNQQVVRTDRLVKEITNFSSFSSADVKGMLDMLRFVLDFHLQLGEIVELEGIGTFNVSLKNVPSDKEKDIIPSKVSFNKVVFRSSKELKKNLQWMEVERADEGSRLKILSSHKRKENILYYLELKGYISSSTCRGLNGCSKYLALKDLQELQKEGKIIRIGSKNNAQYLLKG